MKAFIEIYNKIEGLSMGKVQKKVKRRGLIPDMISYQEDEEGPRNTRSAGPLTKQFRYLLNTAVVSAVD